MNYKSRHLPTYTFSLWVTRVTLSYTIGSQYELDNDIGLEECVDKPRFMEFKRLKPPIQVEHIRSRVHDTTYVAIQAEITLLMAFIYYRLL